MATRPTLDWVNSSNPLSPNSSGDPALSVENFQADILDASSDYAEAQVATKDIPTPGASEDGKGFVYNHGTGAYVWTDLATQAELNAHEADTTSVHGITDTSALLTSASSAGGDVSGTLSNLQLGAGVVTATEVNGSLKPSGSAATTDESLRRLGTGSTHAAAGDDSRFPSSGEKNALVGTSGTPGSGNKYVTDGDSRNTDTRTPTDSSVTLAKLANAIKPSGSAAAGDEAVRALGTSASTAAAGNDGRFPTSGQKDALVGADGTPSTSNPYATKTTTDNLASLLTLHAAANVTSFNDVLGVYKPVYISPFASREAGGTQLTRAVMNGVITNSAFGWAASASTGFQFGSIPLNAALMNISGRTTKLKVHLAILTNATAPTISFTAGLSVLASAGGANAMSITWSTEVSGSTCTVTTPSASSVTTATSSAFDLPADGVYALVFSMSGAMPATNPKILAQMSLWMAHV